VVYRKESSAKERLIGSGNIKWRFRPHAAAGTTT
jgi:hypothetical protein